MRHSFNGSRSRDETPALGGEARGQSLQRAAQLDRIENVALGKCLDHEAAGRDRLQQAFLFQPHQRHPHRRARHPGELDRLQLRDPLAGPQAAGENEVAQRKLRPHGLRH
ncbi:hypothetical protein ACVMDN_005985 [Bradyrhizobium sp. USDA 4510]